MGKEHQHIPSHNKILTRCSYVLLAASSTFFVNLMHGFLTSSARRKAAVKYPNSYASAEQAEKDPRAFTFNCGASLLFPCFF